MLPVNSALVKTKETPCLEVTKILKKVDGVCYVIQVTARTPEVPFGDAFETITKQCITATGRDKCRYLFTASVQFSKFSMLKGVIKNAAFKGISDYVRILEEVLQDIVKRVGFGVEPVIEKKEEKKEIKAAEEPSWIEWIREPIFAPLPKKIRVLPWVAPIEIETGSLKETIFKCMWCPLFLGIMALLFLWLFYGKAEKLTREEDGWVSLWWKEGFVDREAPIVQRYFPATMEDLIRDEQRGLLEREKAWARGLYDLEELGDWVMERWNGTEHEDWHHSENDARDLLYRGMRCKVTRMRVRLRWFMEAIKRLDRAIVVGQYVNWVTDKWGDDEGELKKRIREVNKVE
jgi:hypothetical protein